ncbi:ABC transporter ATP-binding protein [Otariodibacter oris]|uniref:Iron complex transport system ATP-binding protein n=1 Tax=Otariodibacter oris TaxID=1032623 RepID=A0A420XGE4_9PAST|nr:ATP-binding cassette domain-containing protein [Otariodibacter oris]QGM80067.1 iron ABC transporter ATP-binding protein [Otariodibacter oris]RKR71892.1 iron complex transport system ATP-binding protein [Otariodibacter oris]
MSIEIIKVNKTLSGKTILHDINCIIPQGKMTALIGANGVGKSTLLSIISRLVLADNGTIKLNGHDMKSLKTSDIAKQLTILKQNNHFDLRLTIKELVAFGRYPYSKGRLTQEDNKQIDKAITFMALNDIQDKYIDELSGGQRQRAYIAMILAQDTDYILLDEPLNNLDMKHSAQIMKYLRQLTDQFNKTIVIVIHDINFAACYADYMIAMKDGTVIKQDTVSNIMSSDVLQEIYDMYIPIYPIEDKHIAFYF